MFETADGLWKEYLSQVQRPWPEEDPRRDLSGEVSNRLRQLDRILVHLNAAIDAITLDPVEAQQRRESAANNRLRLITGKITEEEYTRLAAKERLQDLVGYCDSWEDIAIFTETFYFFAWRMVQILRGRGDHKFPGLGYVKARAVTLVRNNLIEHPEDVKKDPNFTNVLVLTSSGPVLRPLAVTLRLDVGNFDSHPDGTDQGLFAAARELREELERRFNAAISNGQA
jgi:hypothetical protein